MGIIGNNASSYYVETAAGIIIIQIVNGKLTSLKFAVDEKHCHNAIENCEIFDLDKRLKSYFDGEKVDFSDVPVDMSYLTDFGQKVMDQLRTVSYGCIISYSELAEMAGSPRAARAVGNVMASNRTPVVIPCHRVVAAKGKIGGFGLGIECKRILLKLEGISL